LLNSTQREDVARVRWETAPVEFKLNAAAEEEEEAGDRLQSNWRRRSRAISRPTTINQPTAGRRQLIRGHDPNQPRRICLAQTEREPRSRPAGQRASDVRSRLEGRPICHVARRVPCQSI